jgi:hypothetical protein
LNDELPFKIGLALVEEIILCLSDVLGNIDRFASVGSKERRNTIRVRAVKYWASESIDQMLTFEAFETSRIV